MVTFRLNKLVRDKLINDYIALGQKPTYRTLNPDEHVAELINKITEEASEIIAASPEDRAKEIADVKQVLDDLIALYGLTAEEVQEAQNRKFAKKGGFREGLFVEKLEVSEDDEWAAYYRREPERFPEISE